METIPAWQVYASMALLGFFLGFAVGYFFELVHNDQFIFMDKPCLLTAALGGALGAPLGYIMVYDPWKPVALVAVAVIGGVVGWVCGPKEDRQRRATDAYREATERQSLVPDELVDAVGTPLHHAAILGDKAAVIALMRNRSDLVNFGDIDDRTPLHYAVENANHAAIAALLKGGADPNAEDRSGVTPLNLAVAGEDRDSAQALLAAGADPNAPDDSGEVPLFYAVDREDTELVAALLKAGANPNYDTAETFLHLAVQNNNAVIVAALLKAGAHPNAQNELGKTPLHYAVEDAEVEIILPVVKALLDAGADPEVEDGEYGWTPIQAAAEKDNQKLVTVLLES